MRKNFPNIASKTTKGFTHCYIFSLVGCQFIALECCHLNTKSIYSRAFHMPSTIQYSLLSRCMLSFLEIIFFLPDYRYMYASGPSGSGVSWVLNAEVRMPPTSRNRGYFSLLSIRRSFITLYCIPSLKNVFVIVVSVALKPQPLLCYDHIHNSLLCNEILI